MRQKLNENPVAQIAVVAVLVVVAAIFLLGPLSGGGESSGSEASSSAPAEAASTESATTPAGAETAVAGAAEGSAPVGSTSAASVPSSRQLPPAVEAAYKRGATVALLIYRPGGIDDRRLAEAASVLDEMPGVAFFAAPASKIARYAPITGPLGVNQVPALIVVSPHRLNGSAPAPATVTYGFQSAGDIRQAVVDAGYHGPQLTYAPN